MDALNKGYINWRDGMKISEHHFEYLQISIEERIKDVRAMTLEYFNYGILGSGIDGKAPLQISVSVQGNDSVLVSVEQCRGITQSGDRVEVLSRNENEGLKKLERTLKIQESELNRGLPILITIKVDNEAMDAYGQPDSEETPLRYPFRKPSLSIETLIPEADTQSVFRNSLIVGRLNVNKGELKWDKKYIPPSTTMRSHSALREFAFDYLDFLSSLEDDLFTIIKNLGSKEQLTQLASTVGSYSKSLLQAVQDNIDEINLFGPSYSPAHYLLISKKLARSLRNTMAVLPNDHKEELLNYVKEIIDLNPAEYTKGITDLIDFEYDHMLITSCLDTIGVFKNNTSRLFREWSQLDYIGKKKKTGIFVGEVKSDSESTKEKKKWDF